MKIPSPPKKKKFLLNYLRSDRSHFVACITQSRKKLLSNIEKNCMIKIR